MNHMSGHRPSRLAVTNAIAGKEEDRGNSFNHMSAKRPSRLAVTVAIALSSASGVGSRSGQNLGSWVGALLHCA